MYAVSLLTVVMISWDFRRFVLSSELVTTTGSWTDSDHFTEGHYLLADMPFAIMYYSSKLCSITF